MQRTVLILTAHTGGGHDSVAQAILDALDTRAGDGLRALVAAPLGAAIDRSYCWALNHAPALWSVAYRMSDAHEAAKLGARLLAGRRGRTLARLIHDEQPDLILSVHALCAQLAGQVLGRLRLTIPHHCVITDLVDIHRAWIAPGVASYYVPTAHARLALLRHGVAPERLTLTGLPVRRPFWAGAALAGHQDAMAGLLSVLVMDGGQPGPALLRVSQMLIESTLPLALSLAWGRSRGRAAFRQRGCVVRHLAADASIAAEMMRADLVLTKAGSVTIAEALALGRPILIHRVASGQETGNPAFLERAGAGCAALTRDALIAQIQRLAAPYERAAMAAHAGVLGRPAAALRLANHLLLTLDGNRSRRAVAG